MAAPVCQPGWPRRADGPVVAAGDLPASDAPRWWRRGSRECGGRIRGGPSRIVWQLERDGVEPLPGRSSVYRALIRHGLIVPGKRKRRREDYRRWERGRSMELWQMDVMGRVHLASGVEVKVVTGIDDHSRFVVCAAVVVAATARPVCQALAEALRMAGWHAGTTTAAVMPASLTAGLGW